MQIRTRRGSGRGRGRGRLPLLALASTIVAGSLFLGGVHAQVPTLLLPPVPDAPKTPADPKTPVLAAPPTAPQKADDARLLLLPPPTKDGDGKALSPTSAEAAQPDAKKKPPVLPPATVEATPTPPDFPTPFDSMPGNPSSNQGVFGSLPVDGYRADTATSGTKVDTPLIDYPGSISVITRDILNDQQAIRLEDILRNVPGAVRLGDSPGNLRDDLLLRGFEVGSRDIRWNGFPDPSYLPRDFTNVQRVEVLSGPASVLYGAGSPSGLVNFITKKPLPTEQNAVDVMFGSFSLQRYAIDSTGPLTQDGSLLYRINASYLNQDSFRDFGYEQRIVVAPVITWMITENTAITLESYYANDRKQADTGVIATQTVTAFNPTTFAATVAYGPIVGPRNLSFNNPNDYLNTTDNKEALFINHKIDENWSARVGLFTNFYGTSFLSTEPVGAGTAASDGVFLGPNQVLRQTQTFALNEQFYDSIAEINGKWQGLLKHNLVLGSEIGYYHSDFISNTSDPLLPTFAVNPSAVFNYANPVYGTSSATNNPSNTLAHISQERYGFYASDMIEINEHWKILAGVRGDIVDTSFTNSYNEILGGTSVFAFSSIQDRIDYHISPRIGVVYQPIPDTLAFYAAYTQSFDPPVTGLFNSPTTLKPELGQTGEVGIKLDLFEKKLSLRTAAFIIDKQNVIAQENIVTSTQIGEIRSQGIEFAIIGNITKYWSIIGNYAYTDSRIISDPGDQAAVGAAPGDRFRNSPYNSANVWTRFNVLDDCAQTLGIGVGLVYVGDRYGDLADDFSLPGYCRVDAGVFYKRGMLNANLYMENLGNLTYYSGAYDANTIFVGTPFNVRPRLASSSSRLRMLPRRATP